MHWIWLVAVIGLGVQGQLKAPAEGEEGIDAPGIHNLLYVAPDVLSGGKPEGDAGFESLKALGIATIVCVDGATPDVEKAKAFGMDYVHIPIGYDGVEPAAAAGIRKVLAEREGPFYIHCHHGKHRGPAMAAIAKRILEDATAEEGKAFLERAGTSPNYPGLWQSVREFSEARIAELDPPLYAVAPVGDLTREMAIIDEHFEGLRAAEETGWRMVPDHPDLTPAQAALLVWERLHELGRAGQDNYDEDYDTMLAESESHAKAVQSALEKADGAAASASMTLLAQSCSACHQQYRNDPLR